MASTFRPVNSPVAIKVEERDRGALSPTTPTPTKATFGQLPLPNSPFPQAIQIPESIEEDKVPRRDNSQHPQMSRGDSEDVDMDDTDGEAHGNEDVAGSDEESVNADGSKSTKKKKSQRFYCTDYPPCTLSFTRSEHLARHIRKHTGERPFQCHCSRRFSRLDNLRQHAQTVHVNEEIPMDSLAAAGTRFQRQLRTDRVRAPGRARASTVAAGGMGGQARGHAKSLSTSSISSVGSNFSARDEMRRRPPPLVMADPRYQYPPEVYSHRPPSPSDFSTPTSATFSAGPSSPHWGNRIASPTSPHRSHAFYAGSQIPTRRLSVPSGGIPFQSGSSPGRPMLGPGSSGTVGGLHPTPYSPTSSVLASPTGSIFSRRESTSGAEEWRRRTWHPDSTNFNANPPSSRLSHVFTVDQYSGPPQEPAPLPVQQQQQPSNSLRLPGIESFGPIPHRLSSDSRNNGPPMVVEPDIVHPPTLLPTTNTADLEEKRATISWDMGLHRGLTKLDITSNSTTSDGASHWAREANQAMDAQADRVRLHTPTVRFHEPAMAENRPRPFVFHQHAMSAPSVTSSRQPKRRGWYQGATSPYAEPPPEKVARVDRMVHPNVKGFQGFPVRETPPHASDPREENSGDTHMARLETLVAVATGEGNATKAY
ncbi:hypothetical protein GGR51DRAFT_561018 [Nemania sp. FL0031]|nr:hypothetical protein GGR51DRAFT_561018 [Nemania sp. FL0031]